MLRTALQSAQLSLDEAIAQAQAQVPDGTVTGAELEVDEGDPVFEIELTVPDGSEVEILLDPQTGSTLPAEGDEAGEAGEPDEVGEQDDAPCAGGAPDIAAAIAAAESAADGQAVEIDAEGCEFEVEVLASDGLHEVSIGPDGTVTKVDSADDESEDTEE